MAERQKVFRYALEAGNPVLAGGMRVTPLARVLELRWRNAAVVWNRPVGLTVEHDGQATRTPIVDVTRLAQVVFGLIAVLLAMMTAAQAAGRRRRNE